MALYGCETAVLFQASHERLHTALILMLMGRGAREDRGTRTVPLLFLAAAAGPETTLCLSLIRVVGTTENVILGVVSFVLRG